MKSQLWYRAEWIEANLLAYEAKIRAWLGRHGTGGIDIDDVIQEMYAKIGTLDDVSCIKNPYQYAISVAHSIVVSHARRSRTVSISPTGSLDEFGIASPEAGPEEIVILREEIQTVADVLAELPERTRNVLWLRRVEELSEQETALRLSISSRTVERHLTRAILHLMRHFQRPLLSAHPTSVLRDKACVDDVDD